ncbi:MAG: hypothetical protein C4329_06430 [Chitinophagaceae bacterium]
MSMDNMKHRRLQELDRSDFEIVHGEPDIPGWDVKLGDGKKVGNVEELIVDAQEKKVRYMVVDLDDNDIGLTEDQKVLIPIGFAELYAKDDDLIIPNVEAPQLRDLPGYHRNELTPEIEQTICEIFDRRHSTTAKEAVVTEQSLYRQTYFNDDNLYKHRLNELETKQASDYERSMKLGERRNRQSESAERNEQHHESEKENEASRMQLVHQRRSNYEQRRYTDDERSARTGKSIEDRIRDEGLRDA